MVHARVATREMVRNYDHKKDDGKTGGRPIFPKLASPTISSPLAHRKLPLLVVDTLDFRGEEHRILASGSPQPTRPGGRA